MTNEQQFENAYGVYVTAHLLERNGLIADALDDHWDTAIRTYLSFLESKYSLGNKSEYDCINDYLENLYELEL